MHGPMPPPSTRPRGLSALFRPMPVILLAVLGLSAVELAIADRKYGVFSGGFGTSSAVDRPGEIALFASGYAVSQALAALLAWSACAWLARKRPAWQALVSFAFVYLGLGLLALTVQYQLHSYFSDAVSFALLKQLGGGSFGDALLFAKSEIAAGLGALALAVLAWWLAVRVMQRFARRLPSAPARPPRARWIAAGAAVLLLALVMIPRAAEAARSARDGYDRGAFSYLEVADTQRALVDLRAREIAALKKFHEAQAVIDRLTGRWTVSSVAGEFQP